MLKGIKCNNSDPTLSLSLDQTWMYPHVHTMIFLDRQLFSFCLFVCFVKKLNPGMEKKKSIYTHGLLNQQIPSRPKLVLPDTVRTTSVYSGIWWRTTDQSGLWRSSNSQFLQRKKNVCAVAIHIWPSLATSAQARHLNRQLTLVSRAGSEGLIFILWNIQIWLPQRQSSEGWGAGHLS